jgi:hypothetical protein
MSRAARTEAEEIQRIADEYQRRGYQTMIRPFGGDLPDFVRGAEPDLVAIGQGEKVVVEIKFKESTAGDPKIAALARAVEAHPGWRFELISVGRRTRKTAESRQPKEPIAVTDARERLAAAQRMATADPEIALLVAWTVIEAAVRALLTKADLTPVGAPVGAMLRQAYSFGLISWRDLESLLRHMAVRNAVVHGLRTSGTKQAVPSLISLAKRLLQLWESA